MRFRFGEVAIGPSGPALGVHGWSDDHNTLVLGLVLFTLYLHIPKWLIRDNDMDTAYGFSFADTGLHLNWGKRSKVLWYPWSWEFYKRWECVDGESYASGRRWWVEMPRGMAHGQLATKHTANYTYKRHNGEVQKRVATYYAEAMEWRWRWLMWLPFPRKVRYSISVNFDDEVGEETGSWKGGVTCCGYDMLPGESPLDTLRRMESERSL